MHFVSRLQTFLLTLKGWIGHKGFHTHDSQLLADWHIQELLVERVGKQGKGREGDREVFCKVVGEHPLLSMNLSQMTVSKKSRHGD